MAITTASSTTGEDKRAHPISKKNPKGAGRPKGSKGGETILREALRTKSEGVILKYFPRIVKTVCEKAEKGDMRAAKMIMDRIIPMKRSVDEAYGKGTGGITIVVEGSANPRLTAIGQKQMEVIDIQPIEETDEEQ